MRTDLLQIAQPIEGANTGDLNYGSANAVAASLSFWVKSSVTGTLSVVLANAGGARTYVTTFVIAVAGVWQLVKLPNIPGDQSGTWPSNNTQGISITITLAAGSGEQTSTLNAWQGAAFLAANTQTNSNLTTNGATFQLTGVMFNVGSFCLPFEKRPVQLDLQICERYYEKSFPQGTAVAQNSGTFNGAISFQNQVSTTFGNFTIFRTVKRTTPTVTTYNPTAGNANWRDATNSADRTASASNIGDKGAVFIGSSGVANSVNELHFTLNARM